MKVKASELLLPITAYSFGWVGLCLMRPLSVRNGFAVLFLATAFCALVASAETKEQAQARTRTREEWLTEVVVWGVICSAIGTFITVAWAIIAVVIAGHQ